MLDVCVSIMADMSDEYCKGFATRSENFNEIVSVPSYLRKTIVTIASDNDFDRCILIG